MVHVRAHHTGGAPSMLAVVVGSLWGLDPQHGGAGAIASGRCCDPGAEAARTPPGRLALLAAGVLWADAERRGS